MSGDSADGWVEVSRYYSLVTLDQARPDEDVMSLF